MTSIGLKNPEWDLSKSKFDEVDDLPLMRSPGPVLMILAAYLIFVLKVGPAFMRKREAYKLKTALVWYNGVQVVLSVFLVIKYAYLIYRMGLFPTACYIERDDMRNEVLVGIWWYFGAKLTELLDTVFFVFRKKYSQITFLHLYHHTIMAIGTWSTLKYFPSHLLFFVGCLNSFVHVLMYTYYGLAAFGDRFAKYLSWKKYMTKIQLIQFVMIVFQYVYTVRSSECPPSRGIALFITANTIFILFLFLNFYRQSYTKTAKKTTPGLKSDANGVHRLTENAKKAE
ncbi:very long chain fatty acid elongase 4-like [Ostrinia nubilalis]|uniref:elongation of very long chain fatty acids protein 4-like n=1 Tax=Ostrinia furnacalis TaxID=93504 RepID=UPI001038BAAA|nr:elongation of very long chain fatty acids protein 4-like [Ostrinia furnacalis]XP_028162529.1 elongation of very long chain fatty acids protein 4-like [Ostrinia furnacalis]